MNGETASTRTAARDALMELMDRDPRVVLVFTDSLLIIRGGPIVEKYPERVIELGIAEQNGVDVCSGLAASGLIPFYVTYAGFITMRACEQVRTFVGYSGVNVKLIGANGGIGGGEREGPTHQFMEDIGILRTIPGMTIVVPADASQVKSAIDAVAETEGPAFVRIGNGRDPVVGLGEVDRFELGKGRVVRSEGDDVLIVACGALVKRALRATELLSGEGVKATVIEIHTIKPVDVDLIGRHARRTGAVVTAEDHNVIGGLGSAIAEVLGQTAPCPLERVGVPDVFARSGLPDELLDAYSMGVDDIVAAAHHVIEKKKQ